MTKKRQSRPAPSAAVKIDAARKTPAFGSEPQSARDGANGDLRDGRK